MAKLSYNKGEWAEVYIFFKVIADRKLYTADADFNPIKNVYLDVLSVLREEVKGQQYKYKTGDKVSIFLNRKLVGHVASKEFVKYKNLLWKLIEENTTTTFSSEAVEKFLNSIHIHKPKSPACIVSDFCGGTVDIVIETKDRSGINRILGFSCKSDLKASSTLLNASGDNTNFIYEVVGHMTDKRMHHFNNLFNVKNKRKKINDPNNPLEPPKYITVKSKEIATADRMNYLHKIGCDLRFVDTAKPVAKANLIKCGGLEMPTIVAEMLKEFYFNNRTGRTTMEDCVEYMAENDVAGYEFDDLKDTYRGKIAQLLLTTFTGMRLGTKWDGRQQVNGGYIVVKNNGDVVAFHSTIADEFKDFLVRKMIMESPSHSRHKDMEIYKENGKYYLKLALQLRFVLNR